MKTPVRYSLILALITFSLSSIAQTELKHYIADDIAGLGLPFSSAVTVGNTIYLSGIIGTVPKKNEVVPGGIKEETRQAMESMKKILEANNSSLEKVVKVTVMMADMSEWDAMNSIYVTYFPGAKPARSAFGTSGLALGARLEIECIAIVNQ